MTNKNERVAIWLTEQEFKEFKDVTQNYLLVNTGLTNLTHRQAFTLIVKAAEIHFRTAIKKNTQKSSGADEI